MTRSTRIAVLAAWATLLLIAAACGNAGTAPRSLQRVQFVAREGPTMPVCRVGRRCERAFTGRFGLITADGHHTTIATDTHGRAFLDIPAGTYWITTDHADLLPRLTGAVEAGRSVRAVNGRLALHVRVVDTQPVTLLVDTGIR